MIPTKIIRQVLNKVRKAKKNQTLVLTSKTLVSDFVQHPNFGHYKLEKFCYLIVLQQHLKRCS
tara:strand:+ start:668 stop:856 length:189 start_codon:yes stop_codon:yes gene_type:complete